MSAIDKLQSFATARIGAGSHEVIRDGFTYADARMILDVMRLLEAERDQARTFASFRGTDLAALRDQVERGGCAAARLGETTLECRAESLCGLCRLRAEAGLAHAAASFELDRRRVAEDDLARAMADARNLLAERDQARRDAARVWSLAEDLGEDLGDPALSALLRSYRAALATPTQQPPTEPAELHGTTHSQLPTQHADAVAPAQSEQACSEGDGADESPLDTALDRYHHSAAARELHAMVREPADNLRTLEVLLAAPMGEVGKRIEAVAKRLLLDVLAARAALERAAAKAIGEVAGD